MEHTATVSLVGKLKEAVFFKLAEVCYGIQGVVESPGRRDLRHYRVALSLVWLTRRTGSLVHGRPLGECWRATFAGKGGLPSGHSDLNSDEYCCGKRSNSTQYRPQATIIIRR
ncbi:MAG: hypothetical protein ACJARS_004452, partial [bacterium]